MPWWLVVLVAAGIAGVAFVSYRRPLVPLTATERGTLVGLRVLALAILVFFLNGPVVLRPPAGDGGAVVPVLVDASRSMRVADVGGQPRVARVRDVLADDLLPGLEGQFSAELFAIGDSAAPVTLEQISADGQRSDLTGAIAAIRDRYRGRRVAGIVLLSDGGDTGGAVRDLGDHHGPPVFAVGIGSPDGLRDREIVGLSASDPRLDEALVDLHVSAVSHGFGRSAFELRVAANGRLLSSRRVTPAADGAPVDEIFAVSPDPLTATVYSVSIEPETDEASEENNVRSVLVSPAGRKRRLLAIHGAPGFEHSFMARALMRDPGLELDTIVRKGRDESGTDTFFIQAGGERAAGLTTGFPAGREALYWYDALLIANVEGDFFTRAQLELVADFVAERGGGLLVLGSRSFAQRGFMGTALEVVLPLELNDRRGGLARASFDVDRTAPIHTVRLTPEGRLHPAMRIGGSPAQSDGLWSALPPLAAVAPLGGPRPGATVLAVSATANGGVYPLVAVQRYGSGRAMVFAGEASWRWRMMMPSEDRSHEFFWRQSARWLAASAPDPVAVTVPDAAEPGDSIEISVDARDAAFSPAGGAVVEATITEPGGDPRALGLRRDAATPGRFVATVRLDQPGLYRVHVDAQRGSSRLGMADRWLHVGGSDREFADPRLNEGTLRRLAASSGGRYVRGEDARQVVSWLRSVEPQTLEPERRDFWHHPGAFALVIALLSIEWLLRRRWGLR
jgi:uncharacterized membrane protein